MGEARLHEIRTEFVERRQSMGGDVAVDEVTAALARVEAERDQAIAQRERLLEAGNALYRQLLREDWLPEAKGMKAWKVAASITEPEEGEDG
jgi:hypothetical protein